jgi:membrane protease subunit (stomatin/prohibitin family)
VGTAFDVVRLRARVNEFRSGAREMTETMKEEMSRSDVKQPDNNSVMPPTAVTPPPVPQTPSQSIPVNAGNFCTKCGTANPVDAHFCKNCGNALDV